MLANALELTINKIVELMLAGFVSIIMGIGLALLIVNKIKVKLKLEDWIQIMFKIILSFVFVLIIFYCIMYFGIVELMLAGIVSIIMGIGLALLIVNKIKFKDFTLSKPEIITFKIILSFVFVLIIFYCFICF